MALNLKEYSKGMAASYRQEYGEERPVGAVAGRMFATLGQRECGWTEVTVSKKP
jgi:hypothetical protein